MVDFYGIHVGKYTSPMDPLISSFFEPKGFLGFAMSSLNITKTGGLPSS